ncbi:tetratricopeptide repeat protein [Paramaledivibacter caminithermalis]|jgi:tetratricopeptide (TPR) repeat protein|uniref:Tetratricopeptide repeat-containing protein n=1 Tax=Paramaledivibacter caminithermalis (strain DSM 15212 / CIP 107654 / DViRD3) TaxID=1121301 RepID=A0A1M6MR29_PARC5|nr:hypothetical protein [Paramaledivibacter caminithermalis]SHJ85975.1 hypothetical protein SAMN02745912_01367 [Paramaledivibacter caminithermalis DSM 15212]
MLTRNIRIGLIVLYGLLAVLFLLAGIIKGAGFFIFAALIMIFTYIRYGSITAAFRSMKKNNLEKTKNLLNETLKVDWLSPSYKGYYYWIKAYVETSEQNLSNAVICYEKALEHGLRTNNDTAIVYFQLAMLAMMGKKYGVAEELLEKSKELKPKQLLIEKISKIESMLHNQKNSDKNLFIEYFNENNII